MKEIEIKAKLRDKKSVMKKLGDFGCKFEPKITQEDVVFSEKIGSVEKYMSNKNFLRLRVKNNGKILFTIKQRQKNHLDKIEHEVEISSKEEMKKALLLIGYKEAVGIKKTRVITHYDGREICLDEVEGLGDFIEMETLVSDGDAEKIQEEMFKFFEKIGIKPDDRINFGYDILMLKKSEK